jgi:hypothetical protein
MSNKELSTWRDWGGRLSPMDFSTWPEDEASSRDVVDRLVTGKVKNKRFRANFLRCAFREAIVTDVDFDGVDFKDTSLVHSEFHDSALTDGSTVSCTFSECTFVRCKFTGAAVHDSLYRQCTFVDCDFQHSMLRNSSVQECHFERCKTSNKLFEGCRVYENDFVETWLDFAAIMDNFGLDNAQLAIDWLRANRSSPENQRFPAEEKITDASWVDHLTPFDRIKLQYYLSGGLLEGGAEADATFRLESWMSLVRAPVNLARLLQDFSDFIFRRYQADLLDSIFVLKLAGLAHIIWTGLGDDPEHAQLGQTGAAIYLQCLRALADLEVLLRESLSDGDFNRVIYRSFDDASDVAIAGLAQTLGVLLPEGDIRILPRNSPLDIVFSGLSHQNVAFLLTLFFATKTRLQISKLIRIEGDARADEVILFSVSVGGAREKSAVEAFGVEQSIPGFAKIKFDVRYSTSLAKSIKTLVRSWTR